MSDFTNNLPPYVVDVPTVKVQTIESVGAKKFLFVHEFKALNASNMPLLTIREKETVRQAITVGRNRREHKFDDTKADANLYKEIVVSGGWHPHGLEPIEDEGLIIPSMKEFYELDELNKKWMPTFKKLSRAECLRLTMEKMQNAINGYLRCSGEILGDEDSIDFMFEESGVMKLLMKIGDPESPSYQFILDCRRPDGGRRRSFGDSFAKAVEITVDKATKVESSLNLRAGANFFSENFLGSSELNGTGEYNQIAFVDSRSTQETIARGEYPQPVSAVEPAPEIAPEIRIKPWSTDLRAVFVQNFNPMFQVEAAAIIMQHYTKTELE